MKKLTLFTLTLLLTSAIALTPVPAQDALQWELPEGANLRLGKGSIEDIAYSPDGTLLAVASPIGIWLYDTATYQEVGLLTGDPVGGILSVAFSPDGGILASGSGAGTIRLWDATTGELQHTLQGHTDIVSSIAFSPDGGILASGSGDSIVRLWDATTGQPLNTLQGHRGHVTSIAFSPDGGILASGSEDTTVRLWDATTGQLQNTLQGHRGYVTSIAFSPDGSTLASSGGYPNDTTVRLWDATTGKPLSTLQGHTDGVTSIAFSSDGSILASGSEDTTVRLWDATTGQLQNTLQGHRGYVTSVAFSSDGSILASGSGDGTVLLWNLAPSRQELVTADIKAMAMYWVDISSRRLYRSIGATAKSFVLNVRNATGIAVHAAQQKVYWMEKTGERSGKIRRANLDGSNAQLVKELTSVPRQLTLDTVQNKLYLTNSWGKIQRMNVDGSGFQPNLITGLNEPKHLAVEISGGKIYWTEPGSIWRANLNGKNREQLLTNLGELGGLAIANGRLYWTERNKHNQTTGRVRRATLTGSDVTTLATLMSVPLGIAVDTAGQKLYWTNSRGRIQRATLTGKHIQNVVAGLGMPASLALGIAPEVGTMVAAPAVFARLAAEKTGLLPNYPNPFNPETWIPYQLAKPAEVTVTIYAADGKLVRTLTLGQRPAGEYQSRSRAAYWDGRNAQGEPVASGVYFYTLSAGDFSATRKMMIRK